MSYQPYAIHISQRDDEAPSRVIGPFTTAEAAYAALTAAGWTRDERPEWQHVWELWAPRDEYRVVALVVSLESPNALSRCAPTTRLLAGRRRRRMDGMSGTTEQDRGKAYRRETERQPAAYRQALRDILTISADVPHDQRYEVMEEIAEDALKQWGDTP